MRRVFYFAPSAILLLQGCTSTPPVTSAETEIAPLTVSAQSTSSRRVFEGCDAAKEAQGHADLAGKKVLITWAWDDVSDRVANLEVPAAVVRVESPYLAVTFDSKIPNIEFYSSVWLTSGHIKALPDGAFGVDLCSATLKEGGW